MQWERPVTLTHVATGTGTSTKPASETVRSIIASGEERKLEIFAHQFHGVPALWA
jgi:hypothetical protein